jgi:hypothetical protein
MADDRLGRRALLGVGVGVLSALSGCGGLFIRPEATTTTPGAPTPTATRTPTQTPADGSEPTAAGPSTASSLPGDELAISERGLQVRRSQLERFAFVTYEFLVENVGTRTIRDVEFRVAVRYEHDEFSRTVATAYPRFVFDPVEGTDDATSDEAREGLQPAEEDLVFERVRFERDGRAQGSTASDRFDLDLSVRRIRYL